MSQGRKKKQYLLLDSRSTPLARGELVSSEEGDTLQVRVLEDKHAEVMEHEEIQLIPMEKDSPPQLGRILRGRSDWIEVQKLKSLDSDRRKNLRMPVHFASFIYPISGRWKGRREVESNDLSCGGIAFFSKESLKEGERMEVVIPITSQPLILRCEILRVRPSDRADQTMYAAKFIDMCDDEDMLVREAVFNVQLSTRPKLSAT